MDPVSRAQNSDTTPKKVFGRPFPKGVSGNPGGRPKKLHFTKLCEQILGKKHGRELLKGVIEDILQKRGMAAVLLMREMAERTEGKVMQAVEMEVSGKVTLEQVLEARKRAGK